ncbi:MAG: 2-C-methyl-D-erythritol 2,4-cyclodiphosphate synthase [Planctomycetota bacterium]
MIDVQYEYRTGIGTDIHRLVAGRDLMLAGLKIPYPMGLMAHSDGDVAIHALIDALLGAAGLGDIGSMFPDSDEQYRGIDSKELLFRVRGLLDEKRWEVVNVDLIIHAEEPKLEAYKGQMKRCLAGLLDTDFAAVNIKAKTAEGLGDIGSGSAIGATAAAMVRRKIKRKF